MAKVFRAPVFFLAKDLKALFVFYAPVRFSVLFLIVCINFFARKLMRWGWAAFT